MRIIMLAIGSRGDVQPVVALGRGLQEAGYEARLVAGDEFEALVTASGLPVAPLGVNLREMMAAHTNIFRLMHDITADVQCACQDGDAILATAMGVAACAVARERRVPFFYVLPMPGLRTRAFPHPLFPPLPLGGLYHHLTYLLTDTLVVRSYPYARCLLQEPRPPYLHPFSARVVPRPPDWGDHAHVTGYWFLTRPDGWEPPEGLVAFLESGPPPVYVGFGSMIDRDPERLAALVVEALRKAGQRAILLGDRSYLETVDWPDTVFRLDSVPHDWLFPRVAAVVHHGGAGTTAAGLRAGIPSVVVPFALDQPFWGRRVHALGVGPQPIPRKKLSVARLANAIRIAVEHEPLRQRAAALGERIRAEDGVGQAVAIIERYLKP
jgi:sterol 3beta-glucosyltransferase